MKLPAMESFVANGYYYNETRPLVVGEAVVLLGYHSSSGAAYRVAATTPLSEDLSLTESEVDLHRAPRLTFTTMRPEGIAPGFALDQPFAVCLDPLASAFAVAGFCWVRVRSLAGWHKYARRCLAQPDDSDQAKAASVGCLDSCGYGPARIVGWASQDQSPDFFRVSDNGPGDGNIYWAIVRL